MFKIFSLSLVFSSFVVLCLVEFLFLIIFLGFIMFLESELMFFISFGKFSRIFLYLSSNSLILLLSDKNHLKLLCFYCLLFLLILITLSCLFTCLIISLCARNWVGKTKNSCILRSRMTCLSPEKIIAFDKWLRAQIIPACLTPIKNWID